MSMIKPNVSFISCSCSKILVAVLVSAASLFLIKKLVHETVATSRVDRTLKSIHTPLDGPVKESIGEPERTVAESTDETFIDVVRESPRVSFSSVYTLDRLQEEEGRQHQEEEGRHHQEEEGRRHHQTQGVPSQLQANQSLALGGFPIRGSAALSQLKASLKDPNFVQKIKDLEAKRQDMYISILDKRGQIVTKEDGSRTIVSYAEIPVRFPNTLKRDISEWTAQELFWLNITHFPWPKDPGCRRYSVSFGDHLAVVGLASYPSSGNTWVRYLVEGISGYYTGSMYNDLALRKTGFYGEGIPANCRKVLTVKTHGHTTEEGSHRPRKEQIKFNHQSEVNHTAILLIRNPFAAILGHRHLDQGGHTGLAKAAQFTGPSWDQFVQIKSESWLNFYSDWLDSEPPNNILVLHYENIKINLRHSLRRILNFLNLSEDDGRLRCAEAHPTGFFKRNHNKTSIEDPFTPKQKIIIRGAIQKLNNKLKEFGKETLPTRLYQYYE